MLDRKLVQFRELLTKAEEDARERLAFERDGIAIEMHGDALDNAIEALEREQTVTVTMQATAALRQIRSALARIADGTFGTCRMCEEEISPRRLRALPWTPHCLRCQVKLDQQEAEESGYAHLAAHVDG